MARYRRMSRFPQLGDVPVNSTPNAGAIGTPTPTFVTPGALGTPAPASTPFGWLEQEAGKTWEALNAPIFGGNSILDNPQALNNAIANLFNRAETGAGNAAGQMFGSLGGSGSILLWGGVIVLGLFFLPEIVELAKIATSKK